MLGYKPATSFRAGVSEWSLDWYHQELGRNVGSEVLLGVLPLSVLAFLRGAGTLFVPGRKLLKTSDSGSL